MGLVSFTSLVVGRQQMFLVIFICADTLSSKTHRTGSCTSIKIVIVRFPLHGCLEKVSFFGCDLAGQAEVPGPSLFMPR
jgi:hypothetical protein